MKSSYRARWLASSEVINQVRTIHLEQQKKNKMASRSLWFQNVTNKLLVSYSACVVYTKTIIHLSVSESGEYLSRRFGKYAPLSLTLRWIIV